MNNYNTTILTKSSKTIITTPKNSHVNSLMLCALVVVDRNSLVQFYAIVVAKEHLQAVDTVRSPWSVFNKHCYWKTGGAIWWIEEARGFSHLNQIHWRCVCQIERLARWRVFRFRRSVQSDFGASPLISNLRYLRLIKAPVMVSIVIQNTTYVS